ncbi:cytochrome p450 monooxygenase [Curvularia clavata]|uniref:Cytochrome p450 monooxygenase n=1 Tax=Curvularia clavata TaxID=95742 RepID=A0A9Q8ZE31_CURCL|nr:cytochrome p450 monooxygenase [Curvularia clavata]
MGALNLIPLFILFAVVAGLGWIGYQIYLYSNQLAERGTKHMEKKNVVFTKDGARVGVKEMSAEKYTDKTQRAFVKTWNAAQDTTARKGTRTVVNNSIQITAFLLYTCVYNLFFHPLKHIPGPLLARATGLPYTYKVRTGKIHSWIQEVHEKYGEAVRVAPAEVSFISAETAWSDVYGFRTGKYKDTGAYLKDPAWYTMPVNGVRSILSADEEAHSRMRRNLSHLFSEKSLRQQESLIRGYVDLLVQRMSEHAAQGQEMDLVRWFNFTTFDIISDLSFGEPLYCLRDSENHLWVDLILASLATTGPLSTRKKYTLVRLYDRLRDLFQDTSRNEQMRISFARKASEKVQRRLDQLENDGDDGRPDFFGQIMRTKGSSEKKLSRLEMDSNSVLFLVAGSETTATALSGFTYLVLRHPDIHAKLVHELRSSFTSLGDINVEKVGKLEYLTACIQEALRMYPPVPTGFPRIVPEGGGEISGHYIPGGTSVYISQLAAYQSERNFKDASKFVPERWIGASEYDADKKEAYNPFSFGPRNCLGKNLAWAELRLIIAAIFFAFDLELVNKQQDWMAEQKLVTLWKKPNLIVRLKAVQE